MKQLKQFFLLITLFVFFTIVGFSPLAEGIPFFEGYSGEALYILVVAGLVGISQGLWPGVSIFFLVKKWLKIEDRAAHYVILIICGLLAAGALFVTGEIDFAGMELTLQNLIALGGVIYTMSQIGYQRFKADNPD